MRSGEWLCAASLIALVKIATPAAAGEEAPKHGGTLTYLIPADAPPSFDGHRETTYVTAHTGAAFYSVLIRINPENPSSTTDFVCDLCTEMPQPTDEGTVYTFKIRLGVKFHDGTHLTAEDVAASWNEIIFPPQGVLSPRASNFMMVEKVEATDPSMVVFHLKYATTAFLPALADPFGWIYEKKILDKDPHWYEKNIMGSGPFKFVGVDDCQGGSAAAQRRRVRGTRRDPAGNRSRRRYRHERDRRLDRGARRRPQLRSSRRMDTADLRWPSAAAA